MLNQGPAIHFDPESRKSWAARLELGQRLKGRELQAAYERARPYIAQGVNQLLKMEGWTLVPNNEWVRLTFFLNLREAFPLAPIDFFWGGGFTQCLFELQSDLRSLTSSSSSFTFQSLARSSHKRVNPRFRLPILIPDLLRPSRYESWSSIFTYRRLVRCKRPNAWSPDLYIDSPTPMADIFYLLQVLIPGMIQIKRIDWIEDVGDQHITRTLPRES